MSDDLFPISGAMIENSGQCSHDRSYIEGAFDFGVSLEVIVPLIQKQTLLNTDSNISSTDFLSILDRFGNIGTLSFTPLVNSYGFYFIFHSVNRQTGETTSISEKWI
jgi:hypothetical protein